MPTELSVNSICEILSAEKLGFRFGKPDRPSETSLACILPILRETSQKRQYITFPETDQVLVHDSGSINKVNLMNSSKENVFVRSGTIFEGKGTQSRALSRSAVLYPGKAVALDVRCVHASHGINTGSSFKYGGITPLSVDAATYRSGYERSDQHTMWNSVSQTSSFMRSAVTGEEEPKQTTTTGRARGVAFGSDRLWKSTSTRHPSASMRRDRPDVTHYNGIRNLMANEGRSEDSLVGDEPREMVLAAGVNIPFGTAFEQDNLKKNFDEFAKNFDAILSKARLHDSQVGLALITDKGCKTIELFDLDKSWEAIHKDSVKRVGAELLRGEDKTSVFEYKPENAINAVRAVLGLPYKTNLIYEHKPSNGEPAVSIFGMTAKRYVGEAVELDSRLIHLTILETE